MAESKRTLGYCNVNVEMVFGRNGVWRWEVDSCVSPPDEWHHRGVQHVQTCLAAAACTSYDRHCGPRAVECAEADLLGDLLAACEAVIRDLAPPVDSQGIPFGDEEPYVTCGTLLKLRAAIAKAKGQATT